MIKKEPKYKKSRFPWRYVWKSPFSKHDSCSIPPSGLRLDLPVPASSPPRPGPAFWPPPSLDRSSARSQGCRRPPPRSSQVRSSPSALWSLGFQASASQRIPIEVWDLRPDCILLFFRCSSRIGNCAAVDLALGSWCVCTLLISTRNSAIVAQEIRSVTSWMRSPKSGAWIERCVSCFPLRLENCCLRFCLCRY
jgi:hypothetical protein